MSSNGHKPGDGTRIYPIALLDVPPAVPMPCWPGAKMAVALAISGAREYPQLAVGYPCPDGTAIYLKYVTEPDLETPLEVYQHCNGLPLLKVIVFDRGRPRPHMADVFWKELEGYMGDRKPLSIIGASVDHTRGRRAHWWHAEG